MATATKKTVTRRIPKASIQPAPAAKVNTVVNKKFPPSSTENFFTAEINNRDFSIGGIEKIMPTIIDSNDDFQLPTDDDSYEISINQGKGNKFREISMFVDGFPHCCGICVIGSFNFGTSQWSKEEVRTILDGIVTSKETRGITLQITTAQGRTCKVVAAALATSSCWTAVKTFKNKNSGNEVTIWVSNNE